MTSMDKAFYFYKPSREGSFLQEMLGDFSGVLVSDFFTAYDSLACEQQKCLVHLLLRDIDDDLLRNPLDSEFKNMAQTFATLLRTIEQSLKQWIDLGSKAITYTNTKGLRLGFSIRWPPRISRLNLP